MLVLIYFSGLHSRVEVFTRWMFRGGDVCLGSLFWVKKIIFYNCIFLGIVCEYYTCVELHDVWGIIRK